jgi:exonuclease SbcD
MRFLHTADWHVGRTMRGRSRADEHVAVLAELAGIAAAHEVDAVLVCGDLFDTAAPTPESEQVVYRGLLDLAATGATVVVLAGNHDNDRRLQAVQPLLALGRVVVRPTFAGPDEAVVEVPSLDGTESMLVAALPFLSQRYVVKADHLMRGEAADAAATYEARYRQLLDWLTGAFRPDTVNVVAAHTFVKGSDAAGSERAAHLAEAYGVSATAFPASCHYVALGHLHRPQAVAGPCPIRYPGSPLQLDFGEAGEAKSAVVVDASPGRPAATEVVPLTSGRPLVELAGTLPELEGFAAGGLDDRAFLKVRVREKLRVGLADEVRALFPGAVDVVVETGAGGGPGATPDGDETRLEGRSPAELFGAYLAHAGVEDPRLGALFDELLEEVGG